MKYFLLIWVIILNSVVCLADNHDESHIELTVGQIDVVKMMDVTRVAIGDEKIVQHKPIDNDELILIGTSPGQTSIHLWQKGNRQKRIFVTVLSKDMDEEMVFARQLVKEFNGVLVASKNNKLIFKGYINSDEKEIFNAMIQQFPNAVNLVKTRAFKSEEIIRMDVTLLEVSKRAASDIGVRWQQTLGGPTIGLHQTFSQNGSFRSANTGGGNDVSASAEDLINSIPAGDKSFYSYSGLTSVLTSRINLLASTGEARILASPRLSAKSGESAQFHSGGQLPLTSFDELGRSRVEFKDFGVSLDIQPSINENGLINTLIATEISAPDFGRSVQGIPVINTRNTTTTVNINAGDTLAISGLGYISQGSSVTRLPLVSKIPYIGELFKSKAKNEETTELIILVTPSIANAKSENNLEALKYSKELKSTIDVSAINQMILE